MGPITTRGAGVTRLPLLLAICMGAAAGVSLGACEDPFEDDGAEMRGCDVHGDTCLELCRESACTLTSACEGVAVGYPDLESCEAADPESATVIDVACDDDLPTLPDTMFIACCCER
jgi:hypothetical protein